MPDVTSIPLEKASLYQQRALMRLHVKVTGDTHALLGEYAAEVRKTLSKVVERDGSLSTLGGAMLLNQVEAEWKRVFPGWVALFQAARREAALIPFGTLAVQHRYYVGMASEVEERRILQEREDLPYPVFDPVLQELMDAAAARAYGDSLILSDRIWNLDAESLGGIRDLIAKGIAEADSAWNMAKEFESYLGFGMSCPRWTSTRLRLTKKQIAAGDKRGLITGNPCESKGVSYNALRLARNEIQIVHHAATDLIFARMPWVEKEQIMLSPAHPVCDVCDDVIAAAPDGEGIYEKGEVALPIHVQCLCWKRAVLMPPDQFVGRLRDWVCGGAWLAMDEYAGFLGLGMRELVASAGDAGWLNVVGEGIVRWLWASEPEQILQKRLSLNRAARNATISLGMPGRWLGWLTACRPESGTSSS